jgi:hypothetical protein
MHVTDLEFVRAFERCEIPNEGFHHRDHIRLAWIYLKLYGPDEASSRIGEAIRNFAAHHGKSTLYHETVTVAWMRLIAQAAHCETFSQVAGEFPEFLDKSYLAEFYSDELLKTDGARKSFADPDRKPLPSRQPSVVK